MRSACQPWQGPAAIPKQSHHDASDGAPRAQPAAAVCQISEISACCQWVQCTAAVCQEAHQGNCNEHGGGDGAHDVGPDAGAVHQALEEGQAALEQGAVLVGQADLEVALQAANAEQSKTELRSKACKACSCLSCMQSI